MKSTFDIMQDRFSKLAGKSSDFHTPLFFIYYPPSTKYRHYGKAFFDVREKTSLDFADFVICSITLTFTSESTIHVDSSFYPKLLFPNTPPSIFHTKTSLKYLAKKMRLSRKREHVK